MNELPYLPNLVMGPPMRQCGYQDEAGVRCTALPVAHVFFTADLKGCFVCDEHERHTRRTWVFYAIHPFKEVCADPRARYDTALNECFVDDEPPAIFAAHRRALELVGA